MKRRSRAKPPSPFRCFNSSPAVIRLVVMMYVRFPLSLRNVESLLFERGVDLGTVKLTSFCFVFDWSRRKVLQNAVLLAEQNRPFF